MIKKIIFTDRSDELLDGYLKDIAKYKLLSESEMADLALAAQSGNEDARNKAVTSNLRFVVTIAKQFQNRGIPLMDLISAGNIGLVKAVDKFDPTKGVTFASYAVYWIKQEIYYAIYWQGREIRLPMSQQLLVIKILEATNDFLKNNGRAPSPEEISDMTDIPTEQINFLAQYSNKLVSVDDYIGGDEDNSQVCDIIPDGEPSLDENLNQEYTTEVIKSILDKLTVREHDLLCMYYGIGMNPVNPSIIANMFGVGGERIRQIKEGALAKLKRVYGKQLQALL